jgi:hypothetical protein
MREDIIFIVGAIVVLVILIYILTKSGLIPFITTVDKQSCVNMIMLACDEYRSKGKVDGFKKISYGCSDIVESENLKPCLDKAKELFPSTQDIANNCGRVCAEFGL